MRCGVPIQLSLSFEKMSNIFSTDVLFYSTKKMSYKFVIRTFLSFTYKMSDTFIIQTFLFLLKYLTNQRDFPYLLSNSPPIVQGYWQSWCHSKSGFSKTSRNSQMSRSTSHSITDVTNVLSRPAADAALGCRVITTDAPLSTAPQTVTLADKKMRRALFHLSSQLYNKTEELHKWSNTGQWHQLHCKAAIPAEHLSPHQLCSFHPAFASPVAAATINDLLHCYLIVDSGCNHILASSGYIDFLIPGHSLAPYEGPPFRQADSSPLSIKGVLTCTLTIGHLRSQEEFIIFNSPSSHREILLGFSYVQTHNLAICGSGLFQFPPSLLTATSAPPPPHKCVMGQDAREGHTEKEEGARGQCRQAANINNATPPQPPLDDFPVLCTQAYTILPKAQQLLLCRVPEMQQGTDTETTFTVCHSEQLEPWMPLLELSIYFQVLQISRVLSPFSLLYCNYTKQTVFIEQNQIVAHCTLMQHAGDDEMAHLSKINPPAFLAYRILRPNFRESSLKSPNISHMELQMECKNDFDLSQADIQSTDPEDISKLKLLLSKYQNIFASQAWSIGNIGSTFHMEPKTGVEPVQGPNIPVPARIRQQCIQIVSRLVDLGLVVESKSPWNSSILFLIKKPLPTPSNQAGDQNVPIPLSQIRICLDFRAVNSSLRQNWVSYEIPKIEQVFQNVQGMSYISILDVNQAFWSKRLATGITQDLCAFTFLGRHMTLTRLPQGTRPSSFVFQECLARIIHEAKLAPYDRLDSNGNQLGSVSNYLDDILLCSKTKEEHFHLLERLFAAFSKNKVKIKLKKCSFLVSEVTQLLGYELNVKMQTLQPSRSLLKNILSLSVPKNKKQVQKIIGTFNFFSNLLPDYANQMVPLYNLLTLDKPFRWGPNEQNSFDWAIRQLGMKPIIFIQDVTKPCYCIVDSAQSNSTGYALLQWNKRLNSFVPIKFQSKRLSIHQRAYSQSQCEALGLSVMASENYALLLHGHHFCFNDSKALGFIARFRFDNLTVHRYHLIISSLSLTFCWLPNSHGLINLADILSRKKINMKDEIVQVLNKKLSKEKIENLKHLNFFGLPEMHYDQVMQLLDSFHRLCDKYSSSEIKRASDKMDKKVNFPPTPQLSAKFKSQVCNIYSSFKDNTIGLQPHMQHCVRTVAVPATGDPSRQVLSPPLASLLQVENKLSFHFPSFSLKHLEAAQAKDKKLLSLSKRFPDKFPTIKGIICKRMKQPALLSHVVCWPTALNLPLISKTHVVDGIIHLGHDKLFSELKQFFYLIGFQKSYKEFSCNYCMLNYRQPKVPRPLGLTFKVSSPRQFLAFDIATIRSDWAQGSFLLICDVVTNFIMAAPCSQCPTAAQVYEIIFCRWVGTMGYPSAYTSDNGKNMSCELSADISHLLNIRHFLISPTHSMSNKCELFNKFLISILRATEQKGMLSEQTYPLVLSLSTLLWNSSPSKFGASPSQLQFFTSNTRTHQFQTFSNLLHQQTRSSLSQHILFISNVLSIIQQKREDLNLQKENEWSKHKEKIKQGSYVFIERDRRPGPGHKLRSLYLPTLHMVVVIKPTYALLLPLHCKLQLYKDPFIAGTKTKRRLLRVPLTKLKLCTQPLKYLDLHDCQKYLDSAAEVLGQSEPVREIILGPPLSPRVISHPFARFWSSPAQVADKAVRSSDPIISFFSPAASPPFVKDSTQHWKNVDQFIRAVIQNDFSPTFHFKVLHTPHHWVYVKSDIKGGLNSSTPPPTCSYRYETTYLRQRDKCRKHRQRYLRDVDTSVEGGDKRPPPQEIRGGQQLYSPPKREAGPHHGRWSQHKFSQQFKFFNDLTKHHNKHFSVVEKKKIFPTLLQAFNSDSDDSDDDQTWPPRVRVSQNLSLSSASISRTSEASHSRGNSIISTRSQSVSSASLSTQRRNRVPQGDEEDEDDQGARDTNDDDQNLSNDNSFHSIASSQDHREDSGSPQDSFQQKGSPPASVPSTGDSSSLRRSSRVRIKSHKVGWYTRKQTLKTKSNKKDISKKSEKGQKEVIESQLASTSQPDGSGRVVVKLSTVKKVPKSKQIRDLN